MLSPAQENMKLNIYSKWCIHFIHLGGVVVLGLGNPVLQIFLNPAFEHNLLYEYCRNSKFRIKAFIHSNFIIILNRTTADST